MPDYTWLFIVLAILAALSLAAMETERHLYLKKKDNKDNAD